MSDLGDVSVMGDEPRQLDGNAAAGLLAEIFTFEMTSAQSTCANCGATGPLGSLLLYGGQVGVILRCPTCEQAQMRIVHASGRYWIDMRGMTTLRIAPALPA